jgi:hypothetical protein
MPVSKIPRRAFVTVLAVVFLCSGAVALWYPYATEVNPYPMKDYNAQTQKTAANGIVAGLNTHDPDNVELMRNHSGNPDREADNARITKNIAAVLPAPGCEYVLVGVEDKGEQDPAAVPWFSGPTRARGFDMRLRHLCPGRQPTPRTLRVIAIPSGMGGYWAEAALLEQGRV